MTEHADIEVIPPDQVGRLTAWQQQALRCARANFGEISEGLLAMEGNGQPRNTLRSLVKRGLLVRREWLDEEWGYRYEERA